MKISGKVIRGKGKGKELGFPTVNIELHKKIESGVYAGKVNYDDKEYKVGIFVNKDSNLLEAHLVGFSGNLYGEDIEIEIRNRIRDVMKFENDEELKRQIKNDIKNICSQE
ncbi:MAG: riboflavin kinase [Candidatus Moranbacteria bacterium]|nr:riboflavin kinase [Candidatus Moranbacteria bacterium]